MREKMYQMTVRNRHYLSKNRITSFFSSDGSEDQVICEAFDRQERDYPGKVLISLLDLEENKLLIRPLLD